MRPATSPALALLLASGLLAGSALAAGGSRPSPPKDPAERAENALKAFDRGKERLAKAEEYAAQAAAAEGRERSKREKDAEKYFRRAAKDFQTATQNDPDMVEAWNQLGYARRKQGKHNSALVAYDKALALDAGYAPAIEYRGEAYLHLGRLEEAQQAYMSLFREHRDLAAQLLASMRAWLDAGGVGAKPEAREAFATWLAEREQLAGQVPAGEGGAGW